MKLRGELEIYKDNEESLNSFKVSVINAFDVQLAVELQSYKHYEREEDVEHRRWHFSEISYVDVLPVMNALAYDINRFERNEQYSYEADEPYYSYGFSDIWTFLTELTPFEFLISMVALVVNQKDSTSQISIKLLNNIVREQLLLHEFVFEKLAHKQIFVAMSFDKTMVHARQSIIKAVENCNFIPVLIDIKEHNNFIVPEIFTEIEKSDLIIADLTQQKTGVYLEAGYAMGRSKPVILTCSKEDFGNQHFDVAQINTIVWTDERDLEQRLIKRIKAIEFQKNEVEQ
ncbi:MULTISPECIES: hypothetical protein [unclassified Paenibacillus]|uniref:hypothetical protein n=1 Tax=unclassified Paenibacillus TaxID=185978 RepID=UPI000CFDF020|nr:MULTISPECIES: hypothetical protein [unclassified Paenibacillus]PRA04830.1 hypothetical protein CQ043_12290 [Paenibacillus sp. MYb63]PRA47825.1 hypothetical protein CQ061_14540 [Paenibacillus sp. MYb67]